MNATNTTKDMKKGVIEKWQKNQMLSSLETNPR